MNVGHTVCPVSVYHAVEDDIDKKIKLKGKTMKFPFGIFFFYHADWHAIQL